MKYMATTTNHNEAMQISERLMNQGFKVVFQRNGNAINIFIDENARDFFSQNVNPPKKQKKSKKANQQSRKSIIPWWVYAGIVLYILYAIFTG